MVCGFITFVVKSYYIYGQFLLHLWLVLHLWSIFITFMVGITFMVFITFMGDTCMYKLCVLRESATIALDCCKRLSR